MRIATLGLVLRGDKILLGLKKKGAQIGAGKLNGPGGKKEETDATLLDCLGRELEEEVGISPVDVEECAIILFWANGTPFQEVHVYRVTRWTGEPRETDSMVPEWHDTAALPLEQMHKSDRAWFPQLVQGAKFNADVYYREPGEGFLKIEFRPYS